MNLEIADKTHSADLIQYLSDVQYDFYPPLFDRIQNRSDAQNIQAYVDKVLALGHAIISTEGGQIAGVAMLYCNDYKNKEAFIPLLSVKGVFSGKGIAKILVGYCINLAFDKGMDTIKVNTWRTNLRAKALYEKLGFEILDSKEDLVFIKRKK